VAAGMAEGKEEWRNAVRLFGEEVEVDILQEM